MFRYNFNDWDSEKFAKLCNALLLEYISKDIKPFFTSGQDGGRDAIYEGCGQGACKLWDGKWVFQYKFHDLSLLGVKKARELVKNDVKSELVKIIKHNPPNNYVLLTNVPFSGVIKVGTHDWFTSIAESYKQIEHIEVWDYTKIEALLDGNLDIQKTFFDKYDFSKSFTRDIASHVSETVLTDVFEKLFELSSMPIPFHPIPQKELKAVTGMLWSIYEKISKLLTHYSSLADFLYAWPELARLQYIFSILNIPNLSIEFGEEITIKTEGGILFNEVLESESIWTSGKDECINATLVSNRTTFNIMKRLLKEINNLSLSIHAEMMNLIEKYPSVARQIAGSTQDDFAQKSNTSNIVKSDILLSPLQYTRFMSVTDAINALDTWINSGGSSKNPIDPMLSSFGDPNRDIPFDIGMNIRQKFYNSIDLNQAIYKSIQKILKDPMILIKEL